MTTEYHVVIGAPPYWTEGQARMLADRLLHETPAAAGVFLWRLEDGKIAEQTVLRETEDE